MKTKTLITYTAMVVCSLLVSFFFIARTQVYVKKAAEEKQMNEQLKQEIAFMRTEKDKLSKENEKFQVDSVVYLNLNNELQEEKKKLKGQLGELETAIKKKETEVDFQKQKLAKLQQEIDKQDFAQQGKLKKDKEALENEMNQLQETLKKERSLYNYNLAVAYTQAKFYDEAVDAYEKSLKSDPKNADAHYNLGLLYENSKNYPEKAIEHYEAYLKLSPNASDREEVEAWIERLR